MKKLTKREKKLLLLFFVVLLAVGLSEFLIIPSIEKTKNLRAERSQLQSEWEEIQSYLELEETLTEEMVLMEEQIEQLKNQISTNTYLYWNYLNEKANKTGVQITNIQEDLPEDSDGKQTIQFNVIGTDEETNRFLQSLEAMPYVFAVTEYAFQLEEENQILTTFTLLIPFSQPNK